MNNEEFLKQLSEDTGMSVTDVEKVMASFEKTLIQGLQKAGSVQLSMGTFQIIVRSGKRGINPRTGSEIVIPEKRVVKFRASESLEKMV